MYVNPSTVSRHSVPKMQQRFAREDDSNSPCGDLSDYCGGTFRGIGKKLDYIQGLGVNAICISPIPKYEL